MNEPSAAFMEFVQRMPKAELHCHLDGSLRPSTLLELSVSQGHVLPVHDATELARWMRVDDARNLGDYLARFEITLAVMQDAVSLERIAHELVLDAALEAYVIDHQIPLEVCPTSNVQTRVVTTFADHPLARYHRLGGIVTISTDNRLMSGVSLTDEYVQCAQHLGFGLRELSALSLASFDAAFLPHAERQGMRNAAERELQQLLADDSTAVMSWGESE